MLNTKSCFVDTLSPWNIKYMTDEAIHNFSQFIKHPNKFPTHLTKEDLILHIMDGNEPQSAHSDKNHLEMFSRGSSVPDLFSSKQFANKVLLKTNKGQPFQSISELSKCF